MQLSSEIYGEQLFACIEGSFFGAMLRGVPPLPVVLIQLAWRR
jgi:hypothetical protein